MQFSKRYFASTLHCFIFLYQTKHCYHLSYSEIKAIWMITQWIAKFTHSNNKITKQDEVQICWKVLFSRTKGIVGQTLSLRIRGCYSDSFGDGFLEAGHFVVSRICAAVVSVIFGTYHAAERVDCSAYWPQGGSCIKSFCLQGTYSGLNGRQFRLKCSICWK